MIWWMSEAELEFKEEEQVVLRVLEVEVEFKRRKNRSF